MNEGISTASVTFRCRKCEGMFHIACTPQATGFEIIKHMGRLLEQECPHCGEEAYGNIILDNVTIKGGGEPWPIPT